ncbi:MAG: hypothetical protein JWN97_3573 [Nocardioides sp.]|nr:hypothetical protein [Nocardioides sp.]
MQRMPTLQRVETWPPTGFHDRLWDTQPEGPGDPLVDAMARAARPVSELYSEALAALGLTAMCTTLGLAIATRREDSGPDEVTVRVWRDQRGMPAETGFVHLGPSVGLLDAAARARLALDVVHTGVRLLIEARGGDPSVLDACRDHVEASGFVYAWSGGWTSSPDRRHEARATYRLAADDDFARARLEVRQRTSGATTSSSDETVAFCTSARLHRSARTLRWRGSAELSFTPYVGLVPSHDGGPLSARSVGDGWEFTLPAPLAVRAPGGVGIQEDPDAPVPTVVGTLA